MSNATFRPGDRVRHLFVVGLRGEVCGKQFRPQPMYGKREQYVVQWDDGHRDTMPADNLVRDDAP